MKRNSKSRFVFGGVFRVVRDLLLVMGLCVIADFVIPQFGGACDSRQEDLMLTSNLETIRLKVELYRIQHGDIMPGERCDREYITEADFVAAMTRKTDEFGYVDEDGVCGPYLEGIPANPYAASDRARRVAIVYGAEGIGEAMEGAGWRFDAVSGEFYADAGAVY